MLRAAREKQDADQEIARLGAEVKAKAAVRPPPQPALLHTHRVIPPPTSASPSLSRGAGRKVRV